MQDDTRPTSSSATLDDHVIAGDLRSCALCGHAGTFHDADAPFSDGTVCMIVRCRCSKFIPPEAAGALRFVALHGEDAAIDDESWTREDQDAEDGDRAADAMMENSSATWL